MVAILSGARKLGTGLFVDRCLVLGESELVSGTCGTSYDYTATRHTPHATQSHAPAPVHFPYPQHPQSPLLLIHCVPFPLSCLILLPPALLPQELMSSRPCALLVCPNTSQTRASISARRRRPPHRPPRGPSDSHGLTIMHLPENLQRVVDVTAGGAVGGALKGRAQGGGGFLVARAQREGAAGSAERV